MNWIESNKAMYDLKKEFSNLPTRTKDNLIEYEAAAKPLRELAIKLHYTRITLLIKNV